MVMVGKLIMGKMENYQRLNSFSTYYNLYYSKNNKFNKQRNLYERKIKKRNRVW